MIVNTAIESDQLAAEPNEDVGYKLNGANNRKSKCLHCDQAITELPTGETETSVAWVHNVTNMIGCNAYGNNWQDESA